MAGSVSYTLSLFTDYDIYLLREGKHFHLWEKMGAHVVSHENEQGVYFAVWAPNATSVRVIGDFNAWHYDDHPLQVRNDETGIWEGFIPNIADGALYKFAIYSPFVDGAFEKSDPYALKSEAAPGTASIVYQSNYKWTDKIWLNKRKSRTLEAPMSIYECHIGSWIRDDDGMSLSYRELANQLIPYVKKLGFTHIEFMPVMEHPFFGSWGYQITSYFAPTSRFGEPDDLRFLINQFHQEGIGVIFDWVPSHFPGDAHSLIAFDGTALYEHADPKKGFHPDWNSYIFNYGRHEVRSFLISNALFWLDQYHGDGLRVDGVASILYLDYSRNEGEWIANEYGGNENLEAIQLLKDFNVAVFDKFPDVVTIAEESTAWPKVSRPTYDGGLGFSYKWMMGWMRDTLKYFSREPIYRKFHQGDITFSLWYFLTENFVLPFSHDEVVYGKGSMLNKMPGDNWHQFANLRLLYAFMYVHPGPKLLFMGCEFAQPSEWNHDGQLEWHLLSNPLHSGIHRLITDLNGLYRNEGAMHQNDLKIHGFEWTDIEQHDQCILCFQRNGIAENDCLMMVANFDQQTHYDYQLGVPQKSNYVELFNSDAEIYGGSGVGNQGLIAAVVGHVDGKEQFIQIMIPPLSILIFKPVQKLKRGKKMTTSIND